MKKRIKVAALPEFDAAPYLDGDEVLALAERRTGVRGSPTASREPVGSVGHSKGSEVEHLPGKP
jgi:hypothetical protein